MTTESLNSNTNYVQGLFSNMINYVNIILVVWTQVNKSLQMKNTLLYIK